MGTCINHPDRETSYLCSKYNIYMCETCLACRDPKIYCKFRSACPIWFISRQRSRMAAKAETPATDKGQTAAVTGTPAGSV